MSLSDEAADEQAMQQIAGSPTPPPPVLQIPTPLTIGFLIQESFSNSKDHGFHAGKLDIEEKLALIHSEISEALEEYRAKRMDTWSEANSRKPEGFWVELADVVIRLGDLIGLLGFGADKAFMSEIWGTTGIYSDAVADFVDPKQLKKIQDTDLLPIPKALARLHLTVSNVEGVVLAHEIVGEPDPIDLAKTLALVFTDILHLTLVRESGSLLIAAIIDKMIYNRSRPYKHGGKVC
jgi:hypothetical protein